MIDGKRLPSIGDPDLDWQQSLPVDVKKRVAEAMENLNKNLQEKVKGTIVCFGTAGEMKGNNEFQKLWNNNQTIKNK